MARDDFWRLLVELSRNDGVTIFISTHFMNEAARCDRISLMHAGRVLAQGAPAELVKAMGAETLEQAFIAHLQTAAREGETPVALIFQDRLRPGAARAVTELKKAGLAVTLLSGDAEAPVAAMAMGLGIGEWRSEVLPAEKAAFITTLTAGGARVLMVGDGLNDTVALASAHVSVSPASALDAARVASDIVLLGQDLGPIVDARRIAVQARRRIKQNFALSLAYNVVAVPVALVGLATPLIAALAMSTSSLTVTLNALRLK